MGHRANLVIIGESDYELFYSRGAAASMASELFWGPEHAERFIRDCEEVTKDRWLTTVWAEGGVVFDSLARVLLFFGDHVFQYDASLRRVFMACMHVNWPGWELRWAFRGQIGLGAYCGIPPESLLEHGVSRMVKSEADLNHESSWEDIIVSFRTEAGLRFYPLSRKLDDFLAGGSDLVGCCTPGTGFERYVWKEDVEFPMTGVHVDVPKKQLHYWTACEWDNYHAQVQANWEGWDVFWHGDQFETHLGLVGDRLVLEHRSRKDLLRLVFSTLIKKVAMPENEVNALREHGIKIDPIILATNDHRSPLLSDAAKLLILRKAYAALGVLGIFEEEVSKLEVVAW